MSFMQQGHSLSPFPVTYMYTCSKLLNKGMNLRLLHVSPVYSFNDVIRYTNKEQQFQLNETIT